jgi:hypothetical protein
MLNPITNDRLDELKNNHQNIMNNGLPIITKALFVTRLHFEDFVNSLPQDCDAIKICFIRHEIPPQDRRILPAGNNLSQLSLILVPMKNTNRSTWESEVATGQNSLITTLCFCVPGVPDGSSTGHCPPASGCPGG